MSKEEVSVGDYVEMSAKRLGKVKFVGELPGKKGQFYGVELWKGDGKNNGEFEDETYFDCVNSGMGVFVIPKAILYILDVPNNFDPFERLAKQKAAKAKKKKQMQNSRNGAVASKNKNKYKSNNKSTKKPNKSNNKNKNNKSKTKTKTKPSKNKSKKPNNINIKKKDRDKLPKGRPTTPSKRSSFQYSNRYNEMAEDDGESSLNETEIEDDDDDDRKDNSKNKNKNVKIKNAKPSKSVMSIGEFKKKSLTPYIGKGDNFDIAKRICKFYDKLFDDTDTVCLVANIEIQPSTSVTMDDKFERRDNFKKEGKYVYCYRAIAHSTPNVIVKKECFKSCVKGLAMDNDNCKEIRIQLNALFGDGCHVVRSKKISFDIYSRFSDGYECEMRLPNGGDYVLAWRR